MKEHKEDTIEWRFNSITNNPMFTEIIEIFLKKGYEMKHMNLQEDGSYVVKFSKKEN